MTDCGWRTTSIRAGGTPKRKCASMTSSPLFIMVAESIEIFGPIFQVGCASASSTVMAAKVSRARSRNGPPEPVSTMRRTSSLAPQRSAWWTALAGRDRGVRRAESHRPHERGDDHVGLRKGSGLLKARGSRRNASPEARRQEGPQMRDVLLALDRNELGVVPSDLRREPVDRAAGRERDDAESFREGGDHVEGRAADRARRA